METSWYWLQHFLYWDIPSCLKSIDYNSNELIQINEYKMYLGFIFVNISET